MNNILLVTANQTTIWKGPPLVISFNMASFMISFTYQQHIVRKLQKTQLKNALFID